MKNQGGITLIALVISIIVMLILAGVSLNATIGDNGIITRAQETNYQMGIAALEEWLQQAYVEYYDSVTESDKGNEIAFLNKQFDYTLLLKDGSRDYIINEGKIYYLLDKSCSYLPKDVRDSLVGGDATEYSEYTRLHDVYGITRDLKVYYCGAGLEGAFGTLEGYDIDPNASATGVNSNSTLKNALADILKEQYDITIDDEKGITLSNVSVVKNLELDGSKYPGITDISGLGDLKNLKTLTLTNLNLSSLKGLEGMPSLYYLYLKNTTSNDYTTLTSCLNLQYLYIYMPNTMDETTANNQVKNLGEGLKNASGLNKLEYFGISGDTVMYDDAIIKNMDNPASYSNTNKLLWTSSYKSNFSSLGESKTGLNAFNDTVKKSIKYVYLNNNNFSNIDALADFSEIVELQLMCNPNLSNVNGISNHTKLSAITLQNCGLTSISGLQGCTSLSRISIQNNSKLTNLVGIEDSKNMVYLIANNCGINNIDSIKDHSKIIYLNLANNINLVSVKYIQHCKALNYIYLDNNTNMNNIEVAQAFNGTDPSLGTTVLIKNCINGYQNIPKQYWDLFDTTATVIDYSYATLGQFLTIDSTKWINLKGRTDITKLKLDGQTKLSFEDTNINGAKCYGINSTLKTLTGMKALSLKGCTQVNSIEFASSMSNLYELDLRSVASTLIDLSVINNSSSINRLIIDNPSIDATKIQKLINKFTGESCTQDKTWYNTAGYSISGLCAVNCNFPDFSQCSGIINFRGACQGFDVTTTRTIDLSGTKVVNFDYRTQAGVTIILPSTCTSINADPWRSKFFNLNEKTEVSFLGVNWLNQKTIDGLASQGLSNCTLKGSQFDEDVTISDSLLSGFRSFKMNGDVSHKHKVTLKINNNALITELILKSLTGIDNFSSIGNLTSLTSLELNDVNLSNISGISALTGLTNLNLYNNKITDISELSTLEQLSTINLSSNNIINLTPLVTAIGNDNKINYTSLNVSNNTLEGYTVADNITALLKLHSAGLQKVTITGNSFSASEVNELINGKTVDGVSYPGFGSGNVIN